jgi:hypothetical protein
MKELLLIGGAIAIVLFLTQQKKPELPHRPTPVTPESYYYRRVTTYPPTLAQLREAQSKGLRFVTRDSGQTYGVIPA